MSNIHLSTRLQQIVAQHDWQSQSPASPRRLPPGALWVAAAMIILLVSVAAGLWRLVDPPRSAPPNVTPAVINPAIGAAPAEPPTLAGARPQDDTPAVIAQPAPARAEVGKVRGGPLPTAVPGVTRRPPFGAWWANRRYE